MFDIAQRRKGLAAFRMKAEHKSARPAHWGVHAMISAVALTALLSACGRAPTDEILRGGIPARTDLHQASAMPPEAIRSVARKDAGWRLIYHPARAPADAEQAAAAALCGLEKKRPEQLVVLPMTAPEDDPGARMIDVICG